ncbi:MAG: alpha/beta hydrolase, partial [Cyanobacteria bacterium J149]
ALRGWQSYLKTEDVIWEFPQGNHFFHYFCPEKVSRKILNFWHITDNDGKNALTEQVKDEVVKVSKTN